MYHGLGLWLLSIPILHIKQVWKYSVCWTPEVADCTWAVQDNCRVWLTSTPYFQGTCRFQFRAESWNAKHWFRPLMLSHFHFKSSNQTLKVYFNIPTLNRSFRTGWTIICVELLASQTTSRYTGVYQSNNTVVIRWYWAIWSNGQR